MEMYQRRIRDGILSKHVYGGQFGQKETTRGVLRMCRTICRRYNLLAQTEYIFDVLDCL